MPRALRFATCSDDVRRLQEGLNNLPSKLAKLVPDGRFGPKTLGRAREFQGSAGLSLHGVVGPLTWEKLHALLAEALDGGVPVMPALPASTFDALRPRILTAAQQQMGKVDFSQQHIGGRPKGLDFLIEMFKFAANVSLTAAKFRKSGTGDWTWTPWIGVKGQEKSWCGIFAVYCIAAERPASRCTGISVAADRSARSSWPASTRASRPRFGRATSVPWQARATTS